MTDVPVQILQIFTNARMRVQVGPTYFYIISFYRRIKRYMHVIFYRHSLCFLTIASAVSWHHVAGQLPSSAIEIGEICAPPG